MAFCNKCGKELAEGAAFCGACGAAANGESNDNKRKVGFDGEIHKCPNCGEILNSFEGVCSACGYELRGTKTAESVKEFVKKLEEIEHMEGNSGWLFHQATDGGEPKLSPIDEQKISLIKNFPIPNTKEDVQEFVILAISNMEPTLYSTKSKVAKKAIIAAWKVKLTQAFQRAKMSFGTSAEFRNIQKIYQEKVVKPANKKKFLIGLAIVVPVLVAVGVVLALTL